MKKLNGSGVYAIKIEKIKLKTVFTQSQTNKTVL